MSKYKKYNDASLIKACLNNKRRAQEEMYDRFSYLVKGIALRYSSHESQAEDMVQESFIKVFQKLDTYNGSGNLGGWIRVITVNTALAYLRKKNMIIYDDEILIDRSIDGTFLKEMHLEDLLVKIRLLPSGYQTVFNLYAIEGYAHNEIADMLGISEGTSKSQYSRAKAELRRMLNTEQELELQNEKATHAKI